MDTQRKRRKWDVGASTEAAPAAGNATAVSSLTSGVGSALPGTTPVLTVPSGPLFQPVIPALRPATSGKPAGGMDEKKLSAVQQAALKVAQKLTQETVGVPPPAEARPKPEEKKEILRDICINDAPTLVRNYLTKRPNLTEIERRSNCLLQTEQEKLAAVATAEAEVQAVLKGERGPARRYANWAVPTAEPPGGLPEAARRRGQAEAGAAGMPTNAPNDTIYIGLEEAPAEFNVSGDAFLQHIASASKAIVYLRGKGSGIAESSEPMHFYITAAERSALASAKELAQNLIDTVKKEYHAKYGGGPAASHEEAGPSLQHPPSQQFNQARPPPAYEAASAPAYPPLAGGGYGYYAPHHHPYPAYGPPPGMPPGQHAAPYPMPPPHGGASMCWHHYHHPPPPGHPQQPITAQAAPYPGGGQPLPHHSYPSPHAPPHLGYYPHGGGYPPPHAAPAPPPHPDLAPHAAAPEALAPSNSNCHTADPATAVPPPAELEVAEPEAELEAAEPEAELEAVAAEPRPRRRFREFTEAPAPAAQTQTASEAASKPAPASSAAVQPMGPPPPRKPAAAGAADAMPPPAARAPAHSGSEPTVSLPGLVPYGDED